MVKSSECNTELNNSRSRRCTANDWAPWVSTAVAGTPGTKSKDRMWDNSCFPFPMKPEKLLHGGNWSDG